MENLITTQILVIADNANGQMLKLWRWWEAGLSQSFIKDDIIITIVKSKSKRVETTAYLFILFLYDRTWRNWVLCRPNRNYNLWFTAQRKKVSAVFRKPKDYIATISYHRRTSAFPLYRDDWFISGRLSSVAVSTILIVDTDTLSSKYVIVDWLLCLATYYCIFRGAICYLEVRNIYFKCDSPWFGLQICMQ